MLQGNLKHEAAKKNGSRYNRVDDARTFYRESALLACPEMTQLSCDPLFYPVATHRLRIRIGPIFVEIISATNVHFDHGVQKAQEPNAKASDKSLDYRLRVSPPVAANMIKNGLNICHPKEFINSNDTIFQIDKMPHLTSSTSHFGGQRQHGRTTRDAASQGSLHSHKT